MHSNVDRQRSGEEDIFHKYRGNFPLHEAARANDVRGVIRLAERKDINALNEEGLSPLIIAAKYGHIRIMETLIKLDVEINNNDKGTERTAIHYASQAGHVDVIDVLLKHGSVLHFKDKVGIYPMHLAAQGGHTRVIEQLRSVQADLNCGDNNGARPIHYAAIQNKIETLFKLEELGADLCAKDKTGSTALHYAAQYDSTSAIKALVRLGVDIDSKSMKGDTPLHTAARNDKKVAIKTLVECGANMYMVNKDKECPIQTASKLNCATAVKMLIMCGSEFNISHKHGQLCVHMAAEHGSCDVLKILHAYRADLNGRDKYDNRPLHYAVKSSSEAAIQKLAELKADLNALGKRGYTALHLATKEKKTNIVNLLGMLGADANIENEVGVFPIYYAAVNSDITTAKCLIRHGAKLNKLNTDGQAMVHALVEAEKEAGLTLLTEMKFNLDLYNQNGDTAIHQAAKAEQVDILQHLKAIGADINARNKFGLSALHVSSMSGSIKQVQILLGLGVDISCKSTDFKRDADCPKRCTQHWPSRKTEKENYWKIKVGMTSLQLAMLNDNKDVVQELSKAFANINDVNEDGETIFHIAVWFCMTDWYKFLISLGADRNARDKFGRTPLHYAAYTGNLDSVRTLLKYGAMIDTTDADGRLPLHYAAEGGHFLLIPEFMAVKTANINCLDKHGQTPLHFASYNGMSDTILELTQLGGDINGRDEIGNAPIHIAAGGGSHETLVQLASLGADVNIQNKEMKTPLHIAADKGQGQAMEYLLLCGCDPNLKDKNDLYPSLHKLTGTLKAKIAKRIKEFNEHNSSRMSSGEISFQAKKINSGKPVEFEKLDVTVAVDSSEPVSPMILLYRTPADAENMEIPVHGLEEILSDKYELRVLMLQHSCKLSVDVPMDGYPGTFEAFLRTTDGKEFKEITTSEESGVPYLKAVIPICKDTNEKFAVVVRPVVHNHPVSQKGEVVLSEVDRRIRVEIPSGTFNEDTSLQLQVLKTDDTERTKGLLISDVINVKTEGDKILQQNVTLKLPLHEKKETDEVVVFAVENEDDIDDETKWKPVQRRTRVQNGSIVFNVEHFSIYFTVMNTIGAFEELKRKAKNQIRRTKQRETSVVFFYAAIPKKNCFLTIFECTTPGRFKRRSEYWLREGFLLHPQVRHSGHFVARPNHRFKFTVSGNLQHVGTAQKDFALTFNPKAYKYQSFYLTKADTKQPWIGEINVTTSGVGSVVSRDNNEQLNSETFVTSVPVEIPKLSNCPIS